MHSHQSTNQPNDPINQSNQPSLQQQTPLLPFNTFGVPATAAFFMEINTLEDLQNLIKSRQNNPQLYTETNPILVLGGGSNILFTTDYPGLILKNNLKGIQYFQENGKHFVTASSGEIWHELVLSTIQNGYGGLENLSLIPGSVGASPVQNIGAYGVELKDHFISCQGVNLEDGTTKTFSKEECRFGYRDSIFKQELKGQYFITSVTIELSTHPIFRTEYGQIQAELDKQGISPQNLSSKAVSDAVIAIRQSKLPDPNKIGNAGSFFKNPVIPKSQFEKLRTEYPDIVGYPTENPDLIKVPAGWLLENDGWKGKTFHNRYGVHQHQSIVLVNYQDSTGQEIFQLSQDIISSIQSKYGINLEREVNIY